MKSILDLIDCVKHLGLRTGWKYWKIRRLCERHPVLVNTWRDNCLAEAARLEATGKNLETAICLRMWADDLEKYAAKSGDVLANVPGQPRAEK